MISMEDWVTIRNLKKRKPELGTRAIAKMLGLSRNTVKRALKNEESPSYGPREYINPELEAFEDYINVQFFNKKLAGSRILNDLRSKGCKVSRSAFYRYLNHLKPVRQKAFMRYETEPGEQGQFDWSPYSVLINGILVKLQVYCLILGFSRYRIYWASLSQRQSSVFEAIEYSLFEIGGVPERLQTDNHSTLVDNASVDNFKWNDRYLKLAEHYGFHPSRSLPAHPWSKGKVENPFSYLENHFILDNQFESFEDFTHQLNQFQDKVNKRVHETTQVEPVILFEEQEKESLAALPPEKFIGTREEFRKVSSDCLISYGGNRYSVPNIFAGKDIWVRESQGVYLHVYSQTNKLVTTHRLGSGKKQIYMKKEHYNGYRGKRGTWDRLHYQFLQRCPGHEDFLARLKAQKRIDPYRHLNKIVDAIRFFEREDIEKVIAICHEYNVYNGDLFIELLHQKGTPIKIPKIDESFLKELHSPAGVIRTLDSYGVKRQKETQEG